MQAEKEAVRVADAESLKTTSRTGTGGRIYGAVENVFRKADDARQRVKERFYLDDRGTHVVLAGLWATTMVIQSGLLVFAGNSGEIITRGALAYGSYFATNCHALAYIGKK